MAAFDATGRPHLPQNLVSSANVDPQLVQILILHLSRCVVKFPKAELISPVMRCPDQLTVKVKAAELPPPLGLTTVTVQVPPSLASLNDGWMSWPELTKVVGLPG
jgi:hypothetical protein